MVKWSKHEWLACSCRMRECPPISHPRRWLCSLPWHECVHVRWVIGQELTVRVSHPNLLYAPLIHGLRVVVFLWLQSLSLFLGNKPLSAKNVRTTEKWLQILALQKISRRKCLCFFALDKLPRLGFFGIPPPQNLTPIIIMEERTKTTQHVNQIKH